MKSTSGFASVIILAALYGNLSAGSETTSPYSVVFYSGRGDRQDVYILRPGGTEPRNLTDHPAWDGWASFVPSESRE